MPITPAIQTVLVRPYSPELCLLELATKEGRTITELIRDTATWHVTIPDQIRPDRPDRPYRPDLTRPAGYDQT